MENNGMIMRNDRLKNFRALPATLLLVLVASLGPARTQADPVPPPAAVVSNAVAPATATAGLDWDAELKEVSTSAGQAKAQFVFWFTNSSASEVVIMAAQSSCFCTVAKLPQQPWPIASGTNGQIEVTMELAGKRGTIEKLIHIETSRGLKMLRARVHIASSAEPGPGFAVNPGGTEERGKNLQAAQLDRQVVFRNQECARCHADPARGVSDGKQLYAAVCAICHDSAHRAPMVPDLRTRPVPADPAHWQHWIARSRPGSVMPAFAMAEGGPLTDPQIASLVAYLETEYSGRPASGSAPGSALR
jgi:cytochrome c553